MSAHTEPDDGAPKGPRTPLLLSTGAITAVFAATVAILVYAISENTSHEQRFPGGGAGGLTAITVPVPITTDTTAAVETTGAAITPPAADTTGVAAGDTSNPTIHPKSEP